MIRSLASARASSAASAAVVSSGYPMAIRSAMVAPLVVAGRLSQSNRLVPRAPHPLGVSAGHRVTGDHGRACPAGEASAIANRCRRYKARGEAGMADHRTGKPNSPYGPADPAVAEAMRQAIAE